jgi:hypothetical protein
MNINRRKFLEIGSLATISSPFLFQRCTPGREPEYQNENLYDLFKDPTASARPFVRWWWNGDRLTAKEILRELDLLVEAGIGGVEINPIRFPEGCDPVGYESLEWLSDEWIDMLKVTLKGAKERGIICDIIVGSGWPFGGEFLEKEEQTQLMTFETLNLEGPATYSFSKEELLNKVDPAIHSKYEKSYREMAGIRLVPYDMQEFDAGIILDEKIHDADISVTIPEGKHVLYYLVKLTGFQAVINGAPGAAGPVLNHYNKVAVDKYLNRMSDRLAAQLVDMGEGFRAMFCDSLEMEGANWNDDLPYEFEKRRGYSLQPYLPFILYKIGHMGNPVEEEYGCKMSSEVELDIQRIRYDFYITRLELFKERFIDSFNTWCHAHGVKSRVQAYGRGYHPLEASESIDIPECETWLRETIGDEFDDTGWRGRAYSVINKFVASGARLSGNKLVSCEEITNTSMIFNATLETIKITGDQSNHSGVSHSVLHGFNYSPSEAPFPGWVQYGTFFNERNPWWPFLRSWTDYKARLSSVFMQAEPFADIAILHPLADMWMKFGPQRDPFPVVNHPEYQHNVWEAIHQNGFGCDYLSEKIVQRSTFANGRMKYGDRSYTTLILLEVETMLPDTAQSLEEFADSGGRIICIEKTPFRSPEFLKHDEKDALVRSTMEKILSKDPERTGTHPAPGGDMIQWFKVISEKFHMKPYMEIPRPDRFILQNYYQYRDKDIFFISNSNAHESREIKVRFNVGDKIPWLWNAETGERRMLSPSGSNNELSLLLEPAGSKLIIFEENTEPTNAGNKTLGADMMEFDKEEMLYGPWSLTLEHVNGHSERIDLPELVDFVEDDRLRTFAGIAIYEKKLKIMDPALYTHIDLGEVIGVSEVILNGSSQGVKWYGFHRYQLENNLKKDDNILQIKITTVLGNYVKTLEDNPVVKKWVSWQRFHRAGLIGPVKLLQGLKLTTM